MKKDVELVIRARDESKRVLDSSVAALRRYKAAQQAATNYRQQVADTRTLIRESYQLQQTTTELGRAYSRIKNPTDAQTAAFNAQRQAVRAAKVAMTEKMGAMTGMRGAAAGSFAAVDRLAIKLREEAGATWQADAATENLARDLPRLAAAHDRAASAATRNAMAHRNAGGAIRGANPAATGGDAAAAAAGAWGSRKGRFLGLRPFEVQNLGYQVNDVATQLASGTSISQTFAQQAGQIIQIFPKLAMSVLRLTPILAPLAIAFGSVAAAMGRTAETAEMVREFDSRLAASADGASHSAIAYAEAARELDAYRGSLKDARAAMAEFAGDGVADEMLDRFGKSAADFAQVFGKKIPEAAREVSDAFTGTYEDVKRLDDSINFLTKEERAHIRQMFESGRASDARMAAFRAFERRMDAGAQKMAGPWSQAMHDLGSAWSGFLDWLGNTGPIRFVIGLLASLAAQIRNLVALLPGANRGTPQAAFQARQQIVDLDAEEARVNARGKPRNRFAAASRQAQLDRIARERAAAQGVLDQASDANSAQAAADTVTRNSERLAKEAEDKALADAKRKGKGGVDKAAREAERRAEAQREFVAGLAEENALREFQTSLLKESERQQRILEALREAELGAAKVGLQLTAEQRAEIERTVSAQYDAEQKQRAIAAIEAARLDLAEKMGEVEGELAFIQRMARQQNINLLTREGQEYAKILGQLYEINEAERVRRAAADRVSGLDDRRGLLETRILRAEDSGDYDGAAQLRDELEQVNVELIEAIDNSIALNAALGTTEGDNAVDRLKVLREQVREFGHELDLTHGKIRDTLASGLMDAWGNFWKGLEEGKNVFKSLRDAFLQFAADFLKNIAKMIMQQLAFNAAKAMMSYLPGASPDGSSGGGGGNILSMIGSFFKFHGGGIAGQGHNRMRGSAGWFANAVRYHGGGVAGLAPDEVPAILRQGEEILTQGDPRHRFNGGAAAEPAKVTVVNAIDPADLLSKALGTPAGDQVFLNWIGQNRSAVQGALA